MFPLMTDRAKKRRINRLVAELEGYEAAMRDRCAQLIELSEPGDDLAVECQLLLERLS